MSDKTFLQIVSSQRLEEVYRALLVSEWPEDHPERINLLIRDLLKESGIVLIFSWEAQTTKKPKATPHRIPVPPNAAPYVKEFIERLDTNLPEVPEDMPERQDPVKAHLSQELIKSTFFLSLQSRFKLEGNIGFLIDCQSLLFSSIVHVMWPALQAKKMDDEQHLLLNYLWMHTIVAWEQQPSHKYFLQSQFFELLGNNSAASNALLLSFRTCNPTDHEWITKGQAYWASLIESERLEEARRFAVALYRNANPEHLEEIMELIDDSYAYARTKPRSRPRKS